MRPNLSLAIVLALAAHGAAQPLPGDWMMASVSTAPNGASGIYIVSPATGAVASLHSSLSYLAGSVMMAPDNVALALSMRPGIALGDGTGRVISLAGDWLFQASVGGGLLGAAQITTGFSGVLDPVGRATAMVNIPPGFPAGVRLFVSAAAADPSLPSGIATANTFGFTTN